MAGRWTAALAWLGGLGVASAAHALAPGDVVENFRLFDQEGRAHELRAAAGSRALVLMIQGNGCPIARQVLPELAKVRAEYRERGVEFLLLNPNLQDTREAVAAEAAEFQIEFPILLDEAQLVAEGLGVERTAEVFVIDPRTWKLLYRGPLDDRVSYERQKPSADHHYLRDALDDVLAGRPVATPAVEGVGCLVNLPGRERASEQAKISYAQRVAPLLIERCVGCHQAGEQPELGSYESVRGAAPAIRELVRMQGQAAGAADPHASLFTGERALGVAQRQWLVHWLEAGAPRGSGEDPLRAARRTGSE